MHDRFELEQAIMGAWATADDLTLLIEELEESGSPAANDVASVLVGLQKLHNLRVKKVFDIFEALIERGDIA